MTTDGKTKLCVGCGITKSLDDDYYKAGASYQKKCKPCHNKQRVACHKLNYKPRKKGYAKLSMSTRSKIEYCIHTGVSGKDISRLCDVKYSTFNRWKRNGDIPPWGDRPPPHDKMSRPFNPYA